MRRLAPFLVIAALAAPAAADQKIQDLTPGFVKEAKACAVEHSGLVKIVTGATERIARLTEPAKADRERDLAGVRDGLAAVEAHCAAVDAYVAFLQEHAASKYKTVERQLDEHDHRVRKLRRAAKAALERSQPQVRALIALLAERATPVATEPRTPAKFPSRRTIDLPALPGSWKLSGTGVTDTVEYAEPGKGITATITSRAFTGATCEQQRASLAKRTPDLAELEAAAGIAWSVRAVRQDKPPHLVSVMCRPAKTGAGGVLATSDVRPAAQTALADQLGAVMLAMLAARD